MLIGLNFPDLIYVVNVIVHAGQRGNELGGPLARLPLRLGDHATILAKLHASSAPNAVVGASRGKAPDGKRGPGLLRFRLGGTSDGRECRHHRLRMVALMYGNPLGRSAASAAKSEMVDFGCWRSSSVFPNSTPVRPPAAPGSSFR